MTKPYTRMDPYLVGIALAYFLFKRKQNNSGKLSLVKLSIGWVIVSVVTLTTVFGIYHQEPDVVTTSFYTVINRSCYACGLAWVIFVCVIGQGVTCQREEETNAYSNYNFVKLVENSVKHLSASKSLYSIPGEDIFPLKDILEDYANPNLFIDALLQPATNKCSDDLTYLQKNTSVLWTMKMLDSYGKPGSGILSGNIKWLGDYDECVEVYVPPEFNSSLGDFQGRYCGVEFSLPYKNATLPFMWASAYQIHVIITESYSTCRILIMQIKYQMLMELTWSNFCDMSYHLSLNEPTEKPSQNGSGDILLAVQADQKTQPAWYDQCERFFNCFCVFVRNASETLILIDSWLFQIILNGFYSVDSFFLLSGFLVAYLFFQQSAKNKGIPWLYFYIHRFIRLTPVYMIVLAFYTSLSGYLGSGPVWTVPNTDPNCHSNWWWNFLYINNLQPAADASFVPGHSMEVAKDWVFSDGSLFQKPSVLAQNVTDFLLQWTDQIDKIYTKPYARIGPYLVGILLAYYFIKRKQNNAGKLRMITLCLGWMVSSGVTLTCLFGLYHNNIGIVAASFYNALNRICFACGLAWVIFVCLIGQGGFVNSILSWKFLIPLSRLTFCTYLIHPIIQNVYFNSLRTLIHYSHITGVMYCFVLYCSPT
ncbi:nose resistant to fluoxetine protein 6 [Trichonephila inaurata madagascariensis]|uniref:Nose resistant to fluoxetine protein 6 n=1 Tax=Trichonephila inaurata madagascariensis TaxID=2747483 RepID=A0A8X7BWD3_9ARAC|nr:nose resistant to fluoxetine protein 6 [Trichonephila inaurata madagascariensis]